MLDCVPISPSPPPPPGPPQPSPPPPHPAPTPPAPPPPALYEIDRDTCRLGGSVWLYEEAQLTRGDYELMGLAVPPERSTRGTYPRDRRFLLTIALHRWDEESTVVVDLAGQLVRIDALLGGRLALDSRGSFDDALARRQGARSAGRDGAFHMQSLHGGSGLTSFAEAERGDDWRQRMGGAHAIETFTGNGRQRQRQRQRRLDGDDGDDDGEPEEEVQPRASVAIRLTDGWVAEVDKTIRLAGRGIVDYVAAVKCHRVKPPSPPPRPPDKFPPPPPDAPNWWDEHPEELQLGAQSRLDGGSDAAAGGAAPSSTIVAVHEEEAAVLSQRARMRGFLGGLPKEMRDAVHAGLGPLIYTVVALIALCLGLLLLRRWLRDRDDADEDEQGGQRGGRRPGVRRFGGEEHEGAAFRRSPVDNKGRGHASSSRGTAGGRPSSSRRTRTGHFTPLPRSEEEIGSGGGTYV